MATERQLENGAQAGAKAKKEELILPANTTASATYNAADAAVNATRAATASVNSYMDTYVSAVSRALEASQSAYVAWLETAFRYQTHALNVLRYALDQSTAEATPATRPSTTLNVYRYALDETIEMQRESRQLIDQVANTLKVGQAAAVDLTQANFRLAQQALNYRNGNLG